MSEAILGGGCFWCLEAIFKRVKGVEEVVSGYAGCKVENPTYKQVCTGKTGCAEVVKITFDPNKISYEELLNIFFSIHDPTQLNRQGNDVGTQYRSVIFPLNSSQEEIAKRVIEKSDLPIVTTIEKLNRFYPAEEYHQNFYDKNPNHPYCQFIIAPKLRKFLKN
ncbi:MAG: peptide-methionine (S)-S-oxide reductase MsrA [Epsilonproteobacteria bacterium]|nr:peptide-methionine (S)-S-oxide reductase MsrA [Campylobacterota bacterium]